MSMTAILDAPAPVTAAPAPTPLAAAPCVLTLLGQPRAGDVCPTYGGEFCPSDQKLVDKCNAC